jgi:UDP-N-acetylglucosamine--dolichyl-phosphate N-acetylglucosaminephosphotransferase
MAFYPARIPNLLVISILCGIISFVTTNFVMPRLIKRLKAANVVGKDIHKVSKPIIAEMGGIGILLGFTIGMMVGMFIYPSLKLGLSIVLLVILIVGIVGMVDDIVQLSSKEKLIFLFIAGLPLTLIAPPEVGWIYILAIPVSVSIASNLTNMLAGLNGVESGLGVISMTSLTIACIVMGKYDVSIITFAMLGALIAFLRYNRIPSRVFPGDVGTLIIGATIAAVAFIGRVKIIALVVLLPNIIDGFLKFYSAGVVERQNHKPTQVKEDGTLQVPPEGFKSLIRMILRKPMKEATVVKILWAIGLFFGIIGIILACILPLDPF